MLDFYAIVSIQCNTREDTILIMMHDLRGKRTIISNHNIIVMNTDHRDVTVSGNTYNVCSLGEVH